MNNVPQLKTESFDVFGYKASKNVIVTFSLLILAGYTLFHFTGMSFPYLTGITNNSLLALAFGIVIISFLDHILPKIFLWLINWLNKLRWKLLFKNVKFK
jgi:hypothetical protein